MKKKVAIYQSPYSSISILEDSIDTSTWHDYIQLTEYVEVDFPELPNEDIVSKQVKIIDKQIEELKEETLKKVDFLKKKKQDLQALGSPLTTLLDVNLAARLPL